MEHPKAVGDRTTLAVMLALEHAGYPFLVPFGENTRYDLVIETGDRLARVQCKDRPPSPGSSSVRGLQCVRAPPHPARARRDYHDQIDYFAVYCPETDAVYLVPIGDIPVKVQGALRVEPPRNNQRRRIRYAAEYELARVRVTRAPRASSGARESSA